MDIVDVARRREGRSRVGEINRAINLAIRPMSDLAQYGVPDLWTAPIQTLTAGAGDCEDYAIAKYVALEEVGVAGEDLRLVVVRDTRRREDHAVVAVRLDGRWLVLDNRWLALVEDVELENYLPMFGMNREGVRRFVAAAQQGLRMLFPAHADLCRPVATRLVGLAAFLATLQQSAFAAVPAIERACEPCSAIMSARSSHSRQLRISGLAFFRLYETQFNRRASKGDIS